MGSMKGFPNRKERENEQQIRNVKNEVDTKLPKDGSEAMTGDLDMGGNDITNIDPSSTTTLQEFLAIGSGNNRWVNCIYEGSYTYDEVSVGDTYYSEGSDSFLIFGVPIPHQKGSKNLYIDQINVGINSADGNNYIDEIKLRGWEDSTTNHVIWNDGTNKTSSGEKTYSFTAEQIGGLYERIYINLEITAASAGNLRISYVKVQYYYA
jgi:hypothetical protein